MIFLVFVGEIPPTKICAQVPDQYWTGYDESGIYPYELHLALARDDW